MTKAELIEALKDVPDDMMVYVLRDDVDSLRGTNPQVLGFNPQTLTREARLNLDNPEKKVVIL